MILATLNARYDELIGKPLPPRVQYPWLQSMRKERDKQVRRERGVNAVERVVILSVAAAGLALEVWFFFYAEYSLPG